MLDTEPPSSYYFSVFLLPFLLASGTSMLLWGLVFLVILLISSAMISGSEVAYFSLDRNSLQLLRDDDSRSAKRIVKLMDKPQYLLGNILVANNLINIAIVVISAFLIDKIFPAEVFDQWSQGLASIKFLSFIDPITLAWIFQILITVVAVTFLLVLFGEVTPKIYANRHGLKFAHFMSGPLVIIGKILYPISTLLVKWSNRVNKENQGNGFMTSSNASKEEIDKAIELTVTDGSNTEDERDILKGIVKFGDVSAKQIMVNRTDIFALDLEETFNEVVEEIKKHGMSRIPVYEGDIDNIKGILYVKDLIGALYQNKEVEWQKTVRTDVLYSPESRMINDILKDFQEQKMHMTIIVDEYGGTAGLLTMEDILEEVIGDIKDEFDHDEELDYIKLDDHNYVFDGKTLLNDIGNILNISIEKFNDVRGDADSIAGLLLEITGQLPRLHQEIRLDKYLFKIIAVNKRRIQQVKITLNE